MLEGSLNPRMQISCIQSVHNPHHNHKAQVARGVALMYFACSGWQMDQFVAETPRPNP